MKKAELLEYCKTIKTKNEKLETENKYFSDLIKGGNYGDKHYSELEKENEKLKKNLDLVIDLAEKYRLDKLKYK